MNSTRFLLCISSLMLVFLFTLAVPSAQARRHVTSSDGPAADVKKVIKAVNAAAGTVEIQFMDDNSTQVYKIDGGTVIKVNDGSGKITDIKTGMLVTDFIERDPSTLDSLSVRD
jgi:hypothetical protein